MAQGGIAALGAYVCYSAAQGMSMFAAVLVSVVAVAVLGVAIGYGLRNAAGHEPSAVVALVATLALGTVISQAIQQIWGSPPVFFQNVIGLAPVRIGAITVNRVQLYGFAAAMLLAAVLTAFLRFTSLGLTVRAVADSSPAPSSAGYGSFA